MPLHRRGVGAALPHWFAPSLLIVTGVGAYLASLSAPFLFDDRPAILENPHIRQLWPMSEVLFGQFYGGLFARPTAALTLALNYAFGGLDVRGYRAVNVLLHIGAALVLYGLLRRTLRRPVCGPQVAAVSAGLALAVASLWLLHPLQTASVTYIIQRCEVLMGLSCLLMLYALNRSAESRHARRWEALAVMSCALGMGSKPVMAAAPVLALLYDRVFLAGSFRAAWRRRRGCYLGLAATWGLLVWLLASAPRLIQPTAGFGVLDVTPLAYARTEPAILLHYLRLILWPHPLVFDYRWPLAAHAEPVPILMVGGLLGLTAFAWHRYPAIGFCGVAFFLLLAPTSSVLPLQDPAFEHRLYLPLAPVLSLLIVGGWVGMQRLRAAARHKRRAAILGLLVIGFGCAWGTVWRNADYRSAVSIWSDTVAKRPQNGRALGYLGIALVDAGDLDGGRRAFARARDLDPRDALALNNLGVFLVWEGNIEEAIAHYRAALAADPRCAEAHANLGFALADTGKLNDAVMHSRRALALSPDFAEAEHALGKALALLGSVEEAALHFSRAAWLKPDYRDARHNLNLLWKRSGLPKEE